MNAAELARKIRNRERCVGYWLVLDAPAATERLARVGYDYIVLDAQHGLIGQAGLLAGLMAIDAGAGAASGAGRGSVGLVRLESGDPAAIGRALDYGAGGVIVPLVGTAEQAAAVV
uniref:aldolase/citrate lyase family protein n=1 Tax=Nonomuraea lactucae TaxID=2249762 RepID=UPI001F05E4ED